MTREIAAEKRLEAVGLFFEGLPYDDISKTVGIGKGSVVAIADDVKAGNFPQFRNVADLVGGMRELSVQLRKARIGPAQAVHLFTLTRRLLALGVEPSLLEGWVKWSQSIAEDEVPRSRIIEAAIKLAKFEDEEGLAYEEALAKLAAASAEAKRLEGKSSSLKADVSQTEERRGQLEAANRELEVENARLQKSLDATAARMKREENRCAELSKQIKMSQASVSQLQSREQELTRQNEKLQQEARGLRKQVDDTVAMLKELDGVGFSGSDLHKLREGLGRMVQECGEQELVARFFDYVADYESFLRLGTAKEALSKEVKALSAQKDALARFGESVKLTASEVAEGIATLNTLRGQGITPQTIASYQRVLRAAGMDPAAFEKAVVEFGGLEQTLAARRIELKKEDMELQARRQATEALEKEEAGTKESIATLRSSALKEITDTAALAATGVWDLCQRLRDDISEWGEVRTEMGKCQDELRFARYFTVPLSEEAVGALVEDMNADIVLHYLAIAQAWCKRKSNPKCRPPKVIIDRYYAIRDFTQVELADVVTWALLILAEGISSVQRRA